MRLVRLKLRGCPFWNLPPITLTQEKDLSPILDIDKLTERQKEVINKSVLAGDIKLIGSDGVVDGTLKAVNVIEGNYVSTDDIDDDSDDVFPEIISITATEEEEEQDIEKETQNKIKKQQDIEKMLSEAKILLNRNGNTVKKMILALKQSDKNLTLLHACMAFESKNKNRAGVIRLIQEAISEY